MLPGGDRKSRYEDAALMISSFLARAASRLDGITLLDFPKRKKSISH